MKTSQRSLSGTKLIPLVLFLFTLAACAPATPVAPVIEFATVVNTVEVTREVTRIVGVPVTVTPSLTPEISLTPSLTPTITTTPTITNTPEPPIVTVLVHAACNYGPGEAYLYKYGLLETSRMEVLGRNEDATWLWVQGIHGWNPCWVRASQVRFDTGSLEMVPVAYSILPYSTLYYPPRDISAVRDGNTVTLFWTTVWMTEDDYRGYLIEAYVCQGGQMVFLPISYYNIADQAKPMLAIEVTDESGCLVPSSVRIYTTEKHGYTGFKVFPWPDYEPTPTSSPTP